MKRNILQAVLLLCLTLTATAHAARHKKAAADSVALVRQQAADGDAAAQNRLGTWYYNGRAVEQNYAEAVAWWTKSADKRNADAIGNLAMCYQLGHGVKADSLTAIALYKAAINEGNANVIPQHERIARTSGSAFSHRLLSECYNEGTGVKRNEATAFTHLEALARLGDVDAQFSVACRYFNTHRYAEAAPLFRNVAKSGQRPAAFYSLGYMLYNGMGMEQDKADGLRLVRLAADKGNRPACYLTGYAYAHGDGVEKDGAKAREYLSKVAATNAKAAQALAEVCLADSVPDFLQAARWAAEAKTPGREWVEKFVSENPEAPFTAYLKGLKAYYADKDYAAALKLFKAADKQGGLHGTAMQALVYADEAYVKHKDKKALNLLRRAADGGNALAAYHLSVFLQNGRGTKQPDTAEALARLERAADAGLPEALCALADRCFNGDGVAKDLTRAARLYLAAEAQNRLTPAAAANLAACYGRRLSALPDADDAKARIAALNEVKTNNRLEQMLESLSF